MAEFSTASAPDFERVPGLFRRWEIIRLLEPGEIYRIENAGTTSDGSPLFALYRRARADSVEGVLQ